MIRVWRLSVCLPRTSGLSLEQRGHRKNKIGTEFAHVARDSNTTFKIKMSKVNLQGRGHIVGPGASRTACYILHVFHCTWCVLYSCLSINGYEWMNFQFITCTGAHNQTSITKIHHNTHNHQSGSNKQHTKNTPTPWLIFTPMERPPQHNDFHCAGATLWLKLHEDKNIAKDNLVLLLQ